MSSGLEEEARKRKERLAAMKRRAEGGPEADGDEVKEKRLPKAVFRSYEPADESTKEGGADVGPAAVGRLEELVEDQIRDTRDLTKVERIDLSLLAPRKLDWDLKRDVEPRLERLERRTQRVIAELIRERLAEGKTSDLLSEVNIHTQRDPQANLSDDEED